MQISSLSALSGASSLFTPNGSRQQQPQTTGQILPDPANSSRSNALFSLPRHSLTASAAALTSSTKTQLTSSQAVAAYQNAMNAQGFYGYQSTLGFSSLIA